MTILVLASTSIARRALLTAAGVPHHAAAPDVDEAAIKASMSDVCAQELADALAEMKAVGISMRRPDTLVLGCDQVAASDDGRFLDKPTSRQDAADQLRTLRGKRHQLHSAAVIAENGKVVWRTVDTATLEMRKFSEEFLANYIDREWPVIENCVGCYRLEAIGAQLFASVQGDHFTILGLPMFQLLEYLRERGVIGR